MARKDKKLLQALAQQTKVEKKSGLSLGLIMVIIGGVWYAVESGYLTIIDKTIYWPIGVIIIGALLLLRR